jgi:hypothetical protein
MESMFEAYNMEGKNRSLSDCEEELQRVYATNAVNAELLRKEEERNKVLQATIDLAYIPHRALVESRDALSKRFEGACGKVTRLESALMRMRDELSVEEVDPDDCRETCLKIIAECFPDDAAGDDRG